MGRLPAGVFPAGARAVAPVPRLFLEELRAAYDEGRLGFFGDLAYLAKPDAFACLLAEARRHKWVFYAKPPFGGPKQVLAYLGPYTHRVAIANSRLISTADDRIAFRWRDYCGKTKVMTLDVHELIRRFLLHTAARPFPSHPAHAAESQ